MTDKNEFLGLPAEDSGIPRHTPSRTAGKECPFCKHTYYLEIWPDEPELVAEKMWGVLEEDLYKMIKDDDDLKEVWALDHRIRNLIRKQRIKRLEAKE